MTQNGPPAASIIKNRMKNLDNEIDKLKDEIVARDKIIKIEQEKRLEVINGCFYNY